MTGNPTKSPGKMKRNLSMGVSPLTTTVPSSTRKKSNIDNSTSERISLMMEVDQETECDAPPDPNQNAIDHLSHGTLSSDENFATIESNTVDSNIDEFELDTISGITKIEPSEHFEIDKSDGPLNNSSSIFSPMSGSDSYSYHMITDGKMVSVRGNLVPVAQFVMSKGTDLEKKYIPGACTIDTASDNSGHNFQMTTPTKISSSVIDDSD